MTEKSSGKFIDLDVEDVRNDDRGPTFLIWLLSVVMFLSVLGGGIILLAAAIPFEPFRVYDYNITTTDACPLTEVGIEQEIEIVEHWYYQVDELDVTTYWLSESDRPYDEVGVTVDEVEPRPRDIYPSNTIRITPPIAGEWRAAGEGVQHGRMFWIIPVTQEIPQQVTEPVTVKEFNTAECAERFSYYYEEVVEE